MGVDTKFLLKGAPSPQEIAAAVRLSFSIEVEVEETSQDDMFRLFFEDPTGRKPGWAEQRMLWVFTDPEDHSEVLSGPKTSCSFGAFGGSVVVAEALASRFGGFVLDADSNDDWRYFEGDSAAPELPAVDRLRINIETILGPKGAIPFAKLANAPEKLDAVISAYQAFKAA